MSDKVTPETALALEIVKTHSLTQLQLQTAAQCEAFKLMSQHNIDDRKAFIGELNDLATRILNNHMSSLDAHEALDKLTRQFEQKLEQFQTEDTFVREQRLDKDAELPDMQFLRKQRHGYSSY